MAQSGNLLGLGVAVVLTIEGAGSRVAHSAAGGAGTLGGLLGHGHVHGLRVIAALAGEGGRAGRIVRAPLVGRLAVAVAQSSNRSLLGVGVLLALEGAGGGIDRLAVFLTGSFVGLAGHGHVHGLRVITALAGEGGRAGRIVRAPLVGRLAVAVAQSGNLLGLGVAVVLTIEGAGSRVAHSAAGGAGTLGGLLGHGHVHGLRVIAALAGEGGRAGRIVRAPLVGRLAVAVAQSGNLLGLGVAVVLTIEGAGSRVAHSAAGGAGTLGGLLGHGHVHGLRVIAALAGEGGRAGRIVRAPLVGRLAVAVAQSGNLLGLGVAVVLTIEGAGSRVAHSAAGGAGTLGGLLGHGHVHGLRVIAALAGEGGRAGRIVRAPLVGRLAVAVAQSSNRSLLGVGVLLALEGAGGGIDRLARFPAGRLTGGPTGHGHVHSLRVIAALAGEGGLAGGIILAPLEGRLAVAVVQGVRLVSRIAVAAGAGVGGVAALRAGGSSYFCLVLVFRKSSSNGMIASNIGKCFAKGLAGCPRLAFAVDCNVLHMIALVRFDGEFLAVALFHLNSIGRRNAAACTGFGSNVTGADRNRIAGGLQIKLNLIFVPQVLFLDGNRILIFNGCISGDLEFQHSKSTVSSAVLNLTVVPHQSDNISTRGVLKTDAIAKDVSS